MFRQKAIAFAALFVLVGAAAPASAGEARIAYDRAALADPAYAAEVYAEIKAAARALCRKELASRPYGRYQIDRCVRDAVDRAVAAADSPALAAAAGRERAESRLAAAN
ncbi:UrcA family protein [Amphiplicatus metriothermophilus]|uniref:UrcA family protein n=1 Tax=Amphiplicatus metriothermophilus TaxID=1519374 RepID=A0A239PLA3_9PROT|nr:UrcA family protein [Amphiplicatus metriothermophilus]MBB5517802.1 UrcA family protein [Amphiplicatus metriothermophilus]SNT67864.1 UrcA family protein [Amphiplicatus metriothermophilus]